MTPAERADLTDLFYAAFKIALEEGRTPPVDLMYFGKYLRVLEPGFSQQNYGYEKLLHLLREFSDLLYIRKDAEVIPPGITWHCVTSRGRSIHHLLQQQPVVCLSRNGSPAA